MADRREPRPARMSGAVLGMLAFGSIGLLAIAGAAPERSPTDRVAHLASVPLSDDDNQRALFTARQLAPGRPVSRCLRVAYTGGPAGSEVRLAADEVTGPLAGSLRVRVEIGTGGGFASCTGFAGNEIYRGLLGGLTGGGPTQPGVATGWQPTADEARTYRITATVPDTNRLQGQGVTATFRWMLVGIADPEPPTPSPGAPSPVASPDGTAEPITSPLVPSASPSTAAPRPAPLSTTRGPGTAPAPAPAPARRGKAAAKSLTGRIGTAVAKAVEAAEVAVELTGRVAKNSGGFPMASLLAMFAFLVAQNRFDRRDPKLAVAPMTGDPYLRFGAPPEEPEANPADNPPVDDPEHDEEGGDDHPYPSR